MCCLFGIINYGNPLHHAKTEQILRKLSICAEARGSDATGIAYVQDGEIKIRKKALPAHRLRFPIPQGSKIIMGHTRLTTQGDAKKNYNNHPFAGVAGGTTFAFAHNGVLYNDAMLRRTLRLPMTMVETDSYIGVQLLERQDELSFQSLKYVAEQVEGTFTFTLLDDKNNIYFVKGSNPLHIYHFPKLGLYLYASTKEILEKAISSLNFRLTKAHAIEIADGGLLCIDVEGNITQAKFDYEGEFNYYWYPQRRGWPATSVKPKMGRSLSDSAYVDDLKSVCRAYGWASHQIDMLLADGFTLDEIEAAMYGELY